MSGADPVRDAWRGGFHVELRACSDDALFASQQCVLPECVDRICYGLVECAGRHIHFAMLAFGVLGVVLTVGMKVTCPRLSYETKLEKLSQSCPVGLPSS